MLLAMLFVTITMSAVPAKRGQMRTLTLTNGTTVQAQLVGDEFGHYWLTDDGVALRQSDTSERYEVIDRSAADNWAQKRRAVTNHQRSKRLSPKKAETSSSFAGVKKGIIILVNFEDVSFQGDNSSSNALFDKIANQKNFVQGDFKGSMRDYFESQSQGAFYVDFDVVGPVSVSENSSYYGQNNSNGDDKFPGTMVIEACKKADAFVDFSDYDWDEDGEVDQVYVVYAGKGEADGGGRNTIWPHAYWLSEAKKWGDGEGAIVLDGVTIDTYACGSELNGSGKTCGIGTMCHEFSHCLGYPDFYDTSGGSGIGMMGWDLMDYGSYNGGGYQPAGYTSYERWEAGWMEPIELTSTIQVDGMESLQDGGDAYIIYNSGNRNEYYLLENRQFTGWDASLQGDGLLILHVDYDQSAWDDNSPNNVASHQRMTWVAADNDYSYYYDSNYNLLSEGLCDDPYPITTNNTFNRNSTPAATFFAKNATDGTRFMEGSVENITQNSDGTISFLFKAPTNIATPTFSPVAGIFDEAQTVTINCATEGVEIHYTTDGTDPTAASELYEEPILIEQSTTLKAVAIVDGELSQVASGRYVIHNSISPTVTTFKRVASTSDMVSGKHYIIACGSKKTAASSMSDDKYLTGCDVTIDNDVITINDDTEVFTAIEDKGSWGFENSEGYYLVATGQKVLAYYDSPTYSWTLQNGTNGVEMLNSVFGTMTYNVSYPRFNVYTSNANNNMIRANLYIEYDGTEPEPETLTLTFSSSEATAILGESFTPPMLTIDPAGAAVDISYTSSNTNVATVDKSTGAVTLKATGTTIITAAFEGNSSYTAAEASYTLTVIEPEEPPVTEGKRYQLITSDDDLESGEDYLLVGYYKTGGYAVYSGFSSDKGTATTIVPSGNIIVQTASAVPLTITLLAGNVYSLYDTKENAYIGAASNSTNNLSSNKSVSTNYYQWGITISSNGVATLSNKGKNKYTMRYNYNGGSPMFRAYQKNQQDVYLYKLMPETGEATAITSPIATNATETTIYTLDGRRIDPSLFTLHSSLKKGIYIINGKKFVIR